MPHFVLAFTSAAKDGRDEAFNDWYDSRHLADMLAVPGIVAARRLQTSAISPNPPPARYLTEFDVEAEDPAIVLAEVFRRSQSGEMALSDTLDESKVQIFVYERR